MIVIGWIAMDLNAFVGLGGIPLIQALVAVVKTMFPKIPSQYFPGVSIAWGVILNVAIVWPVMGSDLRSVVIVGIVAGIAASGLYQWGVDRTKSNRTY
jgi:hypothetical protein